MPRSPQPIPLIPTLSVATERFLIRSRFAVRTRQSYAQDLALLLAEAGTQSVPAALTPSTAAAFLATQEHLTAGTYNRRFAALRSLVGLNKQERLHGLARALFFGRQGRFTDRSYEAQLSRASALSLVVNAIIVWNTEYLAAAAEDLAQQGCPVPESLWPHVTPLHWEHINLVGQYSFDEPLITGHLRPLPRKTAADEISA